MYEKRKSLFSLTEFWLSILIPVVISLILGGVILLNSNLILDLSYTGFNKFVEIYKIPLGVLALLFPLVALVASNHRSRQSAAQIKLGKSQNIFSNFYKHKESFHEVIDRMEKKFDIRFFDPDVIYTSLFPNNSPTSIIYSFNGGKADYILEIRDSLHSLLKESLKIGSSNSDGLDDFDLIKAFYEGLHGVSERLNFRVNSGLFICWSRKYKSPGGEIKNTSVVLEQRKGIYMDEFYVLGHVSICDEIMRNLSEFCMAEKFVGAYDLMGTPLWVMCEEDKVKGVLSSCISFGNLENKTYAKA
ncbi:hypothetical protein [Pseudoalteromonas sp. B62]|uniref:hypothetical protein n=1 Tax=Pseudoalteromonas sp. B62 TaxID=630483 RepID=UPI00301C492D